jgi:hypothetical protein
MSKFIKRLGTRKVKEIRLTDLVAFTCFFKLIHYIFYHVALQFARTYPVFLSVCFPEFFSHVRGFVILL